ncbi:NPP1 family protein [Pseudoalteromonas luteoviolacea]|uniref:Sugar-binding protein n=1 Tax=Pseudoalteromonas luteoviolacea S4054 TaxID=1129367 RepID=A0A0F6AGS5_9GAMM|nr:NPP1 family protein [Pseudoalteromonas luteoviolacea]AOT09282.1 sugar-binding protein [Pseudoalteromonas luteoviolacea]AOT14194.1 sugar-binding protein [Pseudoalteromonas luteoviolacea]AOT19110.1 sugar-binding protein [Pseudoalteromonas luteoviolacea]KKE85001.1 sugar-binding protein [Pseudoalteromonas luteoviolacea S4054]KZN70119.1 sugar-binding protein [Pseudoalteromonas luteoviolacea S4047-1]
MTNKIIHSALLLSCITFNTSIKANDFAALNEALPPSYVINNTEPVFDFDGDGCFPSAGISRTGQQNAGLNTSGSLGGSCRDREFLSTSNTVHRYACKVTSVGQFCAHFYALYFKKDQIIPFLGGGHRHDWEYAAIWTLDGIVTHGSYSAHGSLYTKPANQLPFENGHLKIVYHKDGLLTHAFRFAKRNEVAENNYGYFVTPPIVSWYHMEGDGVNNQALRDKLNTYDYDSATLPVKDSRFLLNLNRFKPDGYPTFSTQDI